MSSYDAADQGMAAPRLAGRLIRALVPPPCFGSLRVVTPAGERVDLRGPLAGPDAVLVLKRWRGLWRVVRGGEIGFAEAFIEGDWTSPDLTRLLEWALRNEQ